MRIDMKAFGRGSKRDIRLQCGAIHLRADDEKDAEYLAVLQRVIQFPDLLSVLLAIGEAAIDKRLSAREKRHLVDMIERVTTLPERQAKGGDS